MRFTHNIKSKYLFLFLFLLFASVHSSAIAGDATSFDPTSVAVEPKAISGVPIGGVIPWTSGTVPEGFLECNGQSTSGYADLAAIVGSTVPDLRGEFIRGWDHGRGTDSGRSILSSQTDSMQSHSHTFSGTGSGSIGGQAGMDAPGSYAKINQSSVSSGRYSSNVASIPFSISGTTSSVGSGSDTRPRNVSMMYIIKAE